MAAPHACARSRAPALAAAHPRPCSVVESRRHSTPALCARSRLLVVPGHTPALHRLLLYCDASTLTCRCRNHALAPAPRCASLRIARNRAPTPAQLRPETRSRPCPTLRHTAAACSTPTSTDALALASTPAWDGLLLRRTWNHDGVLGGK
ncbi:hypothetical protein GUJ93_ZPchr0012g20378 [Zizania palustris]|uniref:Uncharacterized protein n=1 Tax=Zizania palustris TaxID=103762 RepID=A0A8J6BZ62_ZIZPA|nr:hypothetical protein GUJ93_ZPchr0012g20378 [Zizania palustris]